MNYTYPKCTFENNAYVPHKIKDSDIHKFKNELNKMLNCTEYEIFFQTEYYYRDLVKIVFNTNIKTDVDTTNEIVQSYLKKKQTGTFNINTGELIINCQLTNIHDFNFPNLQFYHHTEHKEIHKLKNVLLIKINNYDYWTVCVEHTSKNNNSNNSNILNKLFILIARF